MRFQGAVIKEQGLTFAVVIVKKRVLDSHAERDKIALAFQPAFPGLPVVLMAQDTRGVPTYFGRRDIAGFMANVPISAVPWHWYTVN